MAFDKVISTGEIVIIDETDASILTGNMQVIKGSRNQVYITGLSNPYSPDWSKTNLIIRPFLQASNITKTNETSMQYTPDLFDPNEYPNGIDSYGYIKDIHWYLKDSAGVEEEIIENQDFTFACQYDIDGSTVICSDKRQLAIKSNILNKNDTADIVCRFSFYDPYARLTVSRMESISIVNLASGLSNSKLTTTLLYGDSFINNGVSYLDVIAKFYGDSGEESIGDAIDDSSANASCLWYVRTNDNWLLLDPTQEGQNQANESTNLYKYKKVTNYNTSTGVYTFADYVGSKGNAVLRVYPDLIDGTEIFKVVYTDYMGVSYETVITLHDYTDETRIEIYSTTGNRIKQTDTKGPTLKAIITYKGSLLSDDSPLYNTEFDYYWYKYDYNTGEVTNVFNNASNELIENTDMSNLITGNRYLYVPPSNVLNQAKFILDLTEKTQMTAFSARSALIDSAISEEDYNYASTMCNDAGINDQEVILDTAKELSALE